jgi:hypothetical protein
MHARTEIVLLVTLVATGHAIKIEKFTKKAAAPYFFFAQKFFSP